MNKSIVGQFGLCAALTLALTACERGRVKTQSNRIPKATVLGAQALDECPVADGAWTMADGSSVSFGRSEGFLTLKDQNLSGDIVFDGKIRKLSQISSGKVFDVKGTCRGLIATVEYSADGQTVKRIWRYGAREQFVVMSEGEGKEAKTLYGSPTPQKTSQGSYAPEGA